MLGPMFFGEVPAFAEILRVVGEFENTFIAPAQHGTGVGFRDSSLSDNSIQGCRTSGIPQPRKSASETREAG
jgi:hypothetical protein